MSEREDALVNYEKRLSEKRGDNMPSITDQPLRPEYHRSETDLKPSTPEQQAHSQLTSNVAPTTAEPTDPNRFPSKLPSGIEGTSEVDLNIPENKKQMWDEYGVFWGMDRDDPQREKLKAQWYQKYYNLSTDQYEARLKQLRDETYNPLNRLKNVFEGLSVPGAAYADFAMDAIGMLPGMQFMDNAWDRGTRFDNPVHQNIRRFLSVVLPTMHGTGAVTKGLMASNAPRVVKAAKGMGAYAAVDAAVIGISDQGEEDNFARAAADFFPGVFGPKGWLPLPEWLKTLDSDDPRVRKIKNMYESAGLSLIGNVLGFGIAKFGGKGTLDWMKPADKASEAYKAKELSKAGSSKTIVKIAEIDEVLSSKATNNTDKRVLLQEREKLVKSLEKYSDLEDYTRQAENTQVDQANTAAIEKLRNNPIPVDFDPDISPGILNEGANARQSTPPANIARNMADTAAIKAGGVVGDPAPIMTEAMRKKGLRVGNTSRDSVMAIADKAKNIGRFSGVVDGVRFSNKQMNAAAWEIYNSIIHADTLEDVKSLFLTNRDSKSLLNGKFSVKYANEDQARAAAFALRDLTDRYLGRGVAQSSARTMDTLGREISTISDAITTLKPAIDETRAQDLIIEKMQFLMDEYGINKYISGWQLRNKNWFDQVPAQNADEVLNTLKKEFTEAENAIHQKNIDFTGTLRELANTNPGLMSPLVDAFALTDGDVDTIAKLFKWADDQLSVKGLVKSPNPKQMNLFAKGVWGVVYNNVLSGLSALRAVVGNGAQLILKPINAVLGHGILGMTDNFQGFKRSMYYHGAVFETNRRALRDAYKMMKKVHQNPDEMIEAFRKDFTFKDEKTWDILEQLRPEWEATGDFGRTVQYDGAKLLEQMAHAKWFRTGMTGMVGVDAYTWTNMATYMSRLRAYDDVFSEFGRVTPELLEKAEKKHYAKMFDKNGLLTDAAAKNASGEIALNLDDGVSNWINQATTAYPITKHLFMFPRTGSNTVRLALSYNPISLIPGINKYSKTIWAQSDQQIAAALAEHGIDFATTPNARAIFKELRAEYVGRQAFSGLLTKTLYDYAMAGNIRGNGHYNASRRTKERDQLGYTPKTVNIGGKWVSYKGIPGVDQILSILGDMAYYARDLDQPLLEDYQAKLMWTVSASFLNETPLQGLEPLVALLNGDTSGWSRLGANSLRGYIPLSGAAGVLSNAITSSQKDIHDDMLGYIKNRLPGFSSTLPEQIDIWTGQPLNDIDNPILRILNAINPIKVSGTSEPWRQWLLTTGWDGLSRLKKDSTGTYEYTPTEREQISKYIGEQQLWRKLERLMKSKKYKDQEGMLRTHRSLGEAHQDERLRLKSKHLPLFKEIDKIIKEAQEIAELKMIAENPNIMDVVKKQRLIDKYMKQGRITEASNLAKPPETKNNQIQKIINISK